MCYIRWCERKRAADVVADVLRHRIRLNLLLGLASGGMGL